MAIETEDLLNNLNDFLKKSSQNFPFTYNEPRLPTIFVIGPPRSGTTLTGQLITSNDFFARITNFVARFWEAPFIGAAIEKIIKNKFSYNEDSFCSMTGRTVGLFDASEFGYFWNRWFDCGVETHKLTSMQLCKINIAHLKREVGQLEEIYQKPVVFKNNTWCSFQADWLAKVFPLSIFVVCRRSLLYIAQSLLLARREIHNSDYEWWSVRPSTYNKLKTISNPFEQVIMQARDIELEIQQAISLISASRLLYVDYQELCEDPSRLIDELIIKCNMLGANLPPVVERLKKLENTNKKKLIESEWNKLYEAYENLELPK